MDMDNTVDAVKKYWPWALGGLAALFLFSRLGGGSSDSSGLEGSLYDPNLLANNLAMSQVAAGIQQAQIVADAQSAQAGWATIQSGFQFATNANSDFQAGQIASYMAIKDMSINAATQMGDVTVAGLNAGAASTAAFHNAIAQSNSAAANLVSSVAMANAQSQQATANVVRSVVSWGF